MKLSPLNMCPVEYLEKIIEKINNANKPVNTHASLDFNLLSIFLNNNNDPMINNQKVTGIDKPPIVKNGPKLPLHSVKNGCLFSATVVFHLPVTGLKVF